MALNSSFFQVKIRLQMLFKYKHESSLKEKQGQILRSLRLKGENQMPEGMTSREENHTLASENPSQSH